MATWFGWVGRSCASALMGDGAAWLDELAVEDFRSYAQAVFRPRTRVSVLTGPNGAGKTNLLEAIAYGATGRSPRGVAEEDLVRFGSDGFRIGLRYHTTGTESRATALAIHYRKEGGRTVQRNGKRATLREALGDLPVVYFSPDDLWIIKTGPSSRRALLDALLGQAAPVYADAMVRYRRILSQRNWTLREIRRRDRAATALSMWDPQLVHYGAEIMRRRAAAIVALEPSAQAMFATLGAGSARLSLRYAPGCDGAKAGEDQDWEGLLRTTLTDRQQRDIQEAVTTAGPHRDDIGILVDDHPARSAASQGQQRASSLAVRLAEREFLRDRLGRLPVLLLDDVLSELDAGYRARLGTILWREGQVFLTTTEPGIWRDVADVTYFSVAAGQVSAATPV